MTKKHNQGEIWLAAIELAHREKNCHVLIIQSQTLLEIDHPTTLIIPLTTKLLDDVEPLRVRINAKNELSSDMDALIDQIKSIDNQSFISGPLMKCDDSIMKKIYQSISEILGTVV